MTILVRTMIGERGRRVIVAPRTGQRGGRAA